MEFAALVPLRESAAVLRLAGAELPEVLRRPGHGVLEKLESDAAEGLACCCSAVSELATSE